MVAVSFAIERRHAEEALYKSEERFKQLADNAQDIIYRFRVSPNTQFEYISPSVTKITGYTPDEFYADPHLMVKLIHPDDRALLEAGLNNEIKLEGYNGIRWIHKNGSVVWIEDRNVSSSSDESGITVIEGIARDITERKNTELKLSASELRNRNLLETARDIIFTISAKGTITSLNCAFETITGWSRPEWLGKSIGAGIIHPDDWHRAKDLVRRTAHGEIPPLTEVRILSKSGTSLVGEFIMSPQFEHGKVTEIMGIGRDITKRTLMEEALYNERLLLRTVIDNIPDSIYTKDLASRKTLANVTELRYMGTKSETDVLGKDDFAFYPKERAEKFAADDQAVMQTGTPVLNREEFIYDEKNQKRWLLSSKLPLRNNDNKIVGLVGIGHDITERKLAEIELWESKLSLQAILQSTADGILAIGKGNKVLFANKRFAEMWHIPQKEITNKDDAHLLQYVCDQLTDPQGFLKKVQELYKSTEESFETLSFKDGRVFERVSRPLIQEKQLRGRVWSFRDVTERKRSLKSLLTEKNFSAAVIDSLPGLFYIYDVNGKFLRCNKNFEILSGYSSDEIANMSPLDFFEEPDKTHISEKIRHVFSTGNDATAEVDFVSKNKIKTRHSFSAKLFISEGKQWLIGTAVNISERIREQKEISMLAQTIKGIMECVSITDVNDHILFVNKAFEETYGYSASELIGKSITIVRSPKTSGTVGREILPSTLVGGWKGELWNKRKDGTEFPIFLSTSAVKDQQGNVTALVGIADDITKKKQTEQQLQLMSLSMQSAANAIVITDREGIIISVNPAFCNVTGYTADEAIGKKPSVLKSGKQSAEFYKLLWETIINGEVWKGEIVNKRKDGKEYIEDMTITPVRSSAGEITHFIAIKEDITEKKKAELTKQSLEAQLQQSQKLESLGTLASGIAHDFNNILGIVLGHSSLIQLLHQNPQKVEQSIDAISKATQRGASLVKQLLTFARKTDVTVSAVNVNGVILEVRKLLIEIFPKTIIISESLQKDLPTITADANQIHQVLLNLCVNARDAMPNAGTLTITTSSIMGEAIQEQYINVTALQYVRIDIADTGIGMDETTRKRIFEPFFTTKDVGKGTGLGLATVFGIVERFNGFIDVQSTVGKGTTFTIYFPVRQHAPVVVQSANTQTVEIQGGTETILVIEDEESLRELLSVVLTTKGYTVFIAEDGQRGVEMYENHKNEIAVVLSDMGLPLLSGQHVAKSIRTMNPDAKIVIASGFIDPEIKSVMLQSGIKHFIQKPYSYDEVLQTVRTVIDAREE
ncbi:MAG: PAS domain S-box protein, partial [Bacteroidota bacterium]